MIQKRANGRYAVTVYDPALKRRRQVGTRDKLTEARSLEAAARLDITGGERETVAAFAARWTRDFPRPKQSTDAHNAERVSDFADHHGRMLMQDVTAQTVDKYLTADAKRQRRVPALRAMWNDARRRGVVTHNPWANLGLATTRGNRDRQPPSQEQIAVMLEQAWKLTPPSFAAWLTFGAYTGMRPGELDALRREQVDLEHGEIHVREQWSPAARAFTRPKNGRARTVALTPPARDAFLRLPAESDWAFTTLRGTHYTPSSRSFHWNRVRVGAGLADFTLYLATRHYACWYLYDVLGLPAEDVAIQLGHTDGGALVRTLYGHRDEGRARERIRRAWGGEVRTLRAIDRRDTA